MTRLTLLLTFTAGAIALVATGCGSRIDPEIPDPDPDPFCGDGLLEGNEVCDDGYNDYCGTCNATCNGAGGGSVCGDNEICPQTEACDDGSTNEEGDCNSDCTGPGTGGPGFGCGNGIVEGTEDCDDGFNDDCGTCNADCTGRGEGGTCGDGIHCPENEVCDDGFTDACGSCNVDCTGAGNGSTCGDNETCEETEACDDGYTDNCGLCDATCSGPGSMPWCGDGDICESAELCDDGYADPCGSCNADCTGPGTGSICGDSILCPETEACDDGYADDCGACNSDCSGPGSAPVCGDGDFCEQGEICDDGFTDICGSCNSTCTGIGAGSTCGDSAVCPETEACDDGDTSDAGPCNATCSGPGSGSTCGDGVTDGGETCDDGYNDACGSCNTMCTGPGSGSTCGDGQLCPETETCDDGYADGCGSCNSTCSGMGLSSICGDGVRCEETEACDDGYTDACGSCNADCSWSGFGTICGNGFICPETELCDGSNVAGATCAQQGYEGGTLGCDAESCADYDVSWCTVGGGVCGDDVKDGQHVCDGEIPYDCAAIDANFTDGVPACNGDCTMNLENCTPGDYCLHKGFYLDNFFCDPCHLLNGIPDEDCINLCAGGDRCADYWSPWAQGNTCQLAGFGSDPDCTSCGNGTVDTGYLEWCDGTDLDGKTCGSLGFTGGALDCNANCTFDVSNCTHHADSMCGDGYVTGLEQCDTAIVTTVNCGDVPGFGTGPLSCSSICTWDFSGCTVSDWCAVNSYYGDGQCDPCELIGGTPDPDCAALCGPGDACADYFSWNVAQWSCVAAGYPLDPDCACGNGVRDTQYIEYCDGSDLGGATCKSYGFAGGNLSCDNDCVPDYTECLR